MAVVKATYKCLRCGHERRGEWDPSKGPRELTCPKCKSNSVRRIVDKTSTEKPE